MARTPKAAPLPPLPARRGRKPKAAEPIEFALATDNDFEGAQAVKAEAAAVTPIDKPARGKPGPKPKPRPEAAMPTLSDEDEQQPAMNLDQPDATVEQAPAQDDVVSTEMADPVSDDDGGAATSSDVVVDDASLTASQDGAGSAKPAVRWDRAADAVEFDWPEIERTAAHDGPN